MFSPSREQARRFLAEAWRKRCQSQPATPLEILAADIVVIHPEYHALLDSGEAGLDREWSPEQGETNPFLHLSLHLAIEEQLSIDQPPGIRAVFGQLLARLSDRHAAAHVVLDCLGEVLWRAGRDGGAPNGEAYLDCLRQAAGTTG
jgi:hypothetical protein